MILTPPEMRLVRDIAGFNSATFLDLDEKQKTEFYKRQQLLNSGYPLDYLLSEVLIAGLNFSIPSGTFIPRPETELILPKLRYFIENVKTNLTHSTELFLLDMCCGTGFLGILLSTQFQTILSVDISDLAVKTSAENAAKNAIKNLQTLQSNGFTSTKILDFVASNSNWVLVCNPPYVPLSDLSKAVENNIQFEPSQAIFSGQDGLDFFRLTLQFLVATTYRPQAFFFELDPRNVQKAQQIMGNQAPFYSTEIWKDCEGLNRFLVGKLSITNP